MLQEYLAATVVCLVLVVVAIALRPIPRWLDKRHFFVANLIAFAVVFSVYLVSSTLKGNTSWFDMLVVPLIGAALWLVLFSLIQFFIALIGRGSGASKTRGALQLGLWVAVFFATIVPTIGTAGGGKKTEAEKDAIGKKNKTIMARESLEALSHQVVGDPTGLSAKVQGAGAPKVLVQPTFYQLTIPVKGADPVECLVLKQTMSEDQMISAVATQLSKQFQAAGLLKKPEPELSSPAPKQAGKRKFQIRSAYWEGTDGGVNVTKLAASDLGAFSIGCYHMPIGYNETFARIVGSLVESVHVSSGG